MANTYLYKPNLVIVISGPSGSGKSTVINALCKADETLQLSVSATTRKPRRGEVDGVNYHFLSEAEFEESIQQDRFLEWAKYGDNLYGTLKSEIAAARDAGKDSVLEIEVAGSLQIRAQDLASARSILIFIVPPSFAILERRLRGRKTESETELKQRLDIAKSEVRMIQHYDYWISNPDGVAHRVVKQVVQQIQTIIAAERSRVDTQLIETINPLLGIDCID